MTLSLVRGSDFSELVLALGDQERRTTGNGLNLPQSIQGLSSHLHVRLSSVEPSRRAVKL